jgi:hypothetical protein
MEYTKFQEEYFKNLDEEKKLISNQLNLLEPLAVQLRKPVVSRVANNIWLVILELFCWLAIVGCLALLFIKDNIYPFYVIERIKIKINDLGVSPQDIETYIWAINGFIISIAILFFILARSIRKHRKKNTVIQLAGSSIKQVVGDLLKRKANIESFEHRYITVSANKEVQQINNIDHGKAEV